MAMAEKQIIHPSSIQGPILRTTTDAINASPTQPKILPPKVFWEARENMARFCIDCIVTSDMGVLMGLRTSWPLKDKLCFFGGGLFLGDGGSFEDIAVSKVQSETGLVTAVRGSPIGNYSLIFKRVNDDENGKAGSIVHDITLPLIMDMIGGALKMDKQHSNFVWLNRLDKELHPYVSQVLRDSGLFTDDKYDRNGIRPYQFVMRSQYSEE